jgi:glycolate oxidase FAD binding subunit
VSAAAPPELRPDEVEALRKAAGDAALEPGATLDVDGCAFAATVCPPGGEALARAVRVLAERGLGAVVCGGGSRLALGNPPRGARVLLSTAGLAGVLALDREEGVLHAGAGTPLAALRDALSDTVWELPLDPPGARATLGGTLAAAAVGPRHLGFGRPRDLVLGTTAVSGDGLRARAGGRVVKNVTGYDLAKLHVGALGTLGVIESTWLRLRPRPACVQSLAAGLGAGPAAAAAGVAAARLPTARAVALVGAPAAAEVEPACAGSTWLLLAELAGDEAAVARDARTLAARHGASAAGAHALERVRALAAAAGGTAGLRFRLAVLPDRLSSVSDGLHAAGAALLLHPGSGLVFARFVLAGEGDGAGLDAAWRAVRAAARQGGGFAVLEEAPAWAKPARDVFGDAPAEAPLWRALKQRFDPAGVLNPGRFAGSL